MSLLRKEGRSCALVGSITEVFGIVTTSDLLRTLDELLGGATPTPSQVRRRILAEHDRIGTLLDELEVEARRVPNGTADDAARLRHRVRGAGYVVLAHLDLEERLLWPILREADAFGPRRVEEMEHEHIEQRSLLRSVLDELTTARSAEVLSTGVLELVRAVRDDMVREEALFREEGLLRDDVVTRDSFGG